MHLTAKEYYTERLGVKVFSAQIISFLFCISMWPSVFRVGAQLKLGLCLLYRGLEPKIKNGFLKK